MTRKNPTLSLRVEDAEEGIAKDRLVRLRAGEGGAAGGLVVHRRDVATSIVLRKDRRYLFGRSDTADISFEDDRVSRMHGALRFDDGAWRYEDLGSANGSFVARADEVHRGGGDEARPESVDGVRVDGRLTVALGVGDGVLLGTRRAWFELVAGAPRRAQIDDGDTLVSRAARDFNVKISIAATTSLPVFLLGPSGSGKTHFAQQIHERSRQKGSFQPLNCARLPQDVAQLHSLLLGHVKGAFTSAVTERKGVFWHAHDGTLFLDEVESLPEVAQGFLLDVLEGSGRLVPLGADPEKQPVRPPQIRLISASKLPLKNTGLRPDLCERLAEGHMWKVPTLEERREDVPGLIRTFLAEISDELQIEATFTDDALQYAKKQIWPGQIRDLKSTVRTVVSTVHARRLTEGRDGAHVTIRDDDVRERMRDRAEAFGEDREITQNAKNPYDEAVNPRRVTKEIVAKVLAECGGNKTRAAQRLGIARNTLLARMREFGLRA